MPFYPGAEFVMKSKALREAARRGAGELKSMKAERHIRPLTREKDMSIIEQAKKELALINFGQEDSAVMIEILEKFLGQWDSGGAVFAVAPVLQRLIAGKPLSPLTGEDSEWLEVSDGVWQNIRCSTVFKGKGGAAYNIDVEGRPPIEFPYWPEKAEVGDPVIEFEIPNA